MHPYKKFPIVAFITFSSRVSKNYDRCQLFKMMTNRISAITLAGRIFLSSHRLLSVSTKRLLNINEIEPNGGTVTFHRQKSIISGVSYYTPEIDYREIQ